jgi:hypothetical protein
MAPQPTYLSPCRSGLGWAASRQYQWRKRPRLRIRLRSPVGSPPKRRSYRCRAERVIPVSCWNFAMRASSHGRSGAFSGRATLIEVPFRSVLRFFGHSLISNPEDDCAELLGEGDGAGTRRGMTRAQNNVSMLFPTRVFSVPKRQRAASKSLPLRGSLFGSRRHTPELSP